MAKIYTKTGDLGKTRLVGGSECSKATTRIEAYGAVDELNSYIGVAIRETEKGVENLGLLELKNPTAHPRMMELANNLRRVQNELFNVGSQLACEKEDTRKMLPPVSSDFIAKLEKEIDVMTESLEPLKEFILPGGATSASHLHVARTICRRSERQIVRLIEEGHPEMLSCMQYLNRLSDYLFTAARFANHCLQQPDQKWQKE